MCSYADSPDVAGGRPCSEITVALCGSERAGIWEESKGGWMVPCGFEPQFLCHVLAVWAAHLKWLKNFHICLLKNAFIDSDKFHSGQDINNKYVFV